MPPFDGTRHADSMFGWTEQANLNVDLMGVQGPTKVLPACTSLIGEAAYCAATWRKSTSAKLLDWEPFTPFKDRFLPANHEELLLEAFATARHTQSAKRVNVEYEKIL